MGEGGLSLKRYMTLFREKKGVWAAAAVLAVGICLLIFGGVDGKQAVSSDLRCETDITVLEARVKSLCERVVGVSEAEVMITMDTVGKQIYARNSRVTNSGERSESAFEYVTASGELVPEGEELAHVRGIAVVCRGGNDPNIKLTIVNMLTALFEIPSSAVSVVEGK